MTNMTGSKLSIFSHPGKMTGYYDLPMIKLRNKSWKPECVLSFNLDWRILVFYPEPTHVKTPNTFWFP
jgi:hypothetical protein